MKEFNIKEGSNNFIVKLPTKLSEITKEYLEEVTEHINVAPYYAIVAAVYRAKLPEIISSSKKSRALSTTIVPLYVRGNIPSNMEKEQINAYSKINTCDKLIIAGTAIEIGQELTCPRNLITIDMIVRLYNSNNEFAKGVMLDQNYYYFLDFKLVSISDIKGSYKEVDIAGYNNPFVVKENNSNESDNTEVVN